MNKNNKWLVVLASLTLSIVTFASSAQWRMLTPEGHASARHENGVVAHDGKVFVVGGRGTKQTDVYDPKTNTWTNNNPPPFEMHHITPVSFGDEILVVTGLTGRYPKEQPITHVWHYNPKSDTWRQGVEVPQQRRRGGAGVAVHNNKIYIVGGIKLGHTSGTSNMADVYDPKTHIWQQLPDAPHIRDHSNAVVIDNKLVAFGGRNTSYHEIGNFTAFFKEVSDKVDVYDFDKQSWFTLKSRLPIPTAGAGAVAFNNKIYYVGGEHRLKPANDKMYSLDIKSSIWQQEPGLARGRHGTNAVLIGNKMYIAMGSGNKGGGPELNTIEVFEFK